MGFSRPYRSPLLLAMRASCCETLCMCVIFGRLHQDRKPSKVQTMTQALGTSAMCC